MEPVVEEEPKWKQYMKFLVALISPVVVLALSLANDGITAEEWGMIAAALAVALGVRQVKNAPLTDAAAAKFEH